MSEIKAHCFVETNEVRVPKHGEWFMVAYQDEPRCLSKAYGDGGLGEAILRRLPDEAIVMWRWCYPNGEWSDRLREMESDCPEGWHRERVLVIPFRESDPEPEPEPWMKEAAAEFCGGDDEPGTNALARIIAKHEERSR